MNCFQNRKMVGFVSYDSRFVCLVLVLDAVVVPKEKPIVREELTLLSNQSEAPYFDNVGRGNREFLECAVTSRVICSNETTTLHCPELAYGAYFSCRL